MEWGLVPWDVVLLERQWELRGRSAVGPEGWWELKGQDKRGPVSPGGRYWELLKGVGTGQKDPGRTGQAWVG